MLTMICTLTFADGQKVTGTINAASYESNYPVIYKGAANRLPLAERAEPRQAVSLERFFRDQAKRSGATFRKRIKGSYDRWAL